MKNSRSSKHYSNDLDLATDKIHRPSIPPLVTDTRQHTPSTNLEAWLLRSENASETGRRVFGQLAFDEIDLSNASTLSGRTDPLRSVEYHTYLSFETGSGGGVLSCVIYGSFVSHRLVTSPP